MLIWIEFIGWDGELQPATGLVPATVVWNVNFLHRTLGIQTSTHHFRCWWLRGCVDTPSSYFQNLLKKGLLWSQHCFWVDQFPIAVYCKRWRVSHIPPPSFYNGKGVQGSPVVVWPSRHVWRIWSRHFRLPTLTFFIGVTWSYSVIHDTSFPRHRHLPPVAGW